MFSQLDDTIVAVSSPPGTSVRGIVRLSGPRAFALADEVFECSTTGTLASSVGRRRLQGHIRLDAQSTVPAEAYTFRAPASYTRQDVVELHTIGSPPVLAIVLDYLTDQGARPAEPGEFTARAFFAGAMDLTCVEGVAAMIHARNDSQLRASEALLHGKLSQRSTQLRDELADLLALLEAEIDFTEEPIGFTSPTQTAAAIDRIAGELDSLLVHCPSVERLEVLPEVVLIGPPNAGKSTLFNQLTGMDRAIQSAMPGTTRDVLRAPVSVPGGELMLSDTAGLSPSTPSVSDSGGPSNLATSELCRLAESRAWHSVMSADLVLLVVDGTKMPHELQQTVTSLRSALSGKPLRILANKRDVLPVDQLSTSISMLGRADEVLAISAVTAQGLPELRSLMGKMLFCDVSTHGSDLLALSNRQRSALRDARQALSRARELCDPSTDSIASAELLAMEVRDAMNALALLVGELQRRICWAASSHASVSASENK